MGEGVRLRLCGGERVIVGVTVPTAETDADREDEEVIVAAIERVGDVVLDSEGGIPIVPRKLYEHVGLSLTYVYPDVAPYE